MNITFSRSSLVMFAWMGTALVPPAVVVGQATSSHPKLRAFVYVVQPDHAPAPRYRKVDTGLPAGITGSQLLAEVDPQGSSSWKFGWFTYGESNTRSVAVALKGASKADLFIDVDRDKRFTQEERFAPHAEEPRRWRVPLGAEFITELNQYEQVERSILVRRSALTGFLEIATEGVMQGAISVGGKEMHAVRVDRNSNGRWFDSPDRILLDTNGDGKVDPIGERISCDSICRINGRRFVLQSDMLGERLALVELSGLGSVVPQLRLQSDSAVIGDVSGALVSRAGVRVPIRAPDRPIECPVGDYRIESLTLEVADNEVNYWFRFSSYDTARHYITVKRGESIEVDLLGRVTLSSQQTTVVNRTSASLSITPLIRTSSGLYLSACKTGRDRPTLENRLLTQSAFDTRIIDTSSTGFS